MAKRTVTPDYKAEKAMREAKQRARSHKREAKEVALKERPFRTFAMYLATREDE